MERKLKMRYAMPFAAAALVLSSTAAFSADLAVSPVAPAVQYSPSWSGFYAGAFVGWGWSNDDADTTGTTGFQNLGSTIVPGSLSLDDNGFNGGITAGYNMQSGSFVYGLEGDISYLDYDESDSFTGVAGLGTRLQTRAEREMTFFGTFRGRLGYAPSDRFLLFATGGLAFGQVNYSASVTGLDAPTLVWSGSEDELKFGWTLGGGGEFKATENVSIKLDGLYYDLADSSVTASGNAAVRAVGALNGIDYQSETDNTGFLARIGVNYQF